MANLRLKKIVLEVVNNQLRDNDPPATKTAYQRLLDAGYSASEAKEKIGSVVLEEIYDVMKENQPYNEKRYTDALNIMVQQCIDFEDTHHIQTEWDEWDEVVQKGYEAEDALDENTMIACWQQAWEILQKIIAQEEGKVSVSSMMESQGYQYSLDAWLQDFELELSNTGEHEKRMEFCKKILELLDWSDDDNSGFMAAIGEELYAMGETEKGRKWFEDWLKKEPHHPNALIAFSWCMQEQEGTEKAYQLLKREVIGLPCTSHNEFLFMRAKGLAQHLKLEDDLKWIDSQLKIFQDSLDSYHERYDDVRIPIQKPIMKEKKTYPNDPCPCGSGKKYKKCCGRK